MKMKGLVPKRTGCHRAFSIESPGKLMKEQISRSHTFYKPQKPSWLLSSARRLRKIAPVFPGPFSNVLSRSKKS